MAIGEVEGGALIANSAWVEVDFLADSVREVCGGFVLVCLLEMESELVGICLAFRWVCVPRTIRDGASLAWGCAGCVGASHGWFCPEAGLCWECGVGLYP